MIRRSTLVFLTCLSALSAQAWAIKSTATVLPGLSSAEAVSASTAQMLIAQASGSSATTALDVGSRGSAVEALQRRLQQSGYYSGPVDGIYGLATRRAVSDFQSAVAIEPTGRLDENTWQQLQSFAASEQSADPLTQIAPESAPENAPASPASSGTNLPSAEVNDQTPVATAEDKGTLGKVLGLSLGLGALVASFGIGFFIANRGKAEADDDRSWQGNVNPDPTTGLPYLAGQFSSQSGGSATSRSTASQSATKLTAPAADASSLTANGQMGEAMPLAQTDIIDGLISDLRTPDPARRRKAIWELGQRGNSLAMQPLVEAMVEADSKEKSLVLAALSEIGIRSMKPLNRALAIALQDENPEVRKNAIRDLTRVYDLVVQISQMLGYATEDEDLEVRQTATWALDQLNRIRRSQDIDASMRSLPTGGSGPIDLLSSEASVRRSSQQ